MIVKPIYCSVLVKDGRCISGMNSRVKYCDTLTECEKWVKTVKNRVSNQYTVRVVENNRAIWHTYKLNIESR